MSVQKTVTQKTELQHYCDFCGKKTRSSCVMCRRDCCPSCMKEDPFDWGDYTYKYCTDCWAMPERDAYHKYRYEADAEIDRLEDVWRKAAKERFGAQ